MRRKGLLASLIGVTGACLVTLPVKGARLQTWQFDPGQNRLTFTTEAGVQPQARLLVNPSRLIIDLPGIAYDQPAAQKLVGGSVRAVRIRQHTPETTRLELELSPDYAVRPEDIRVWGVTPQQWVIQLPDRYGVMQSLSPLPPSLKPQEAAGPAASLLTREPQLPRFDTGLKQTSVATPKLPNNLAASLEEVGEETGNRLVNLTSQSMASSQKQINTAYQPAATYLQRIVATQEGFFLETAGANPPVQVYHTRDRAGNLEIVIDLLNPVSQPGITTGLPPGHLGAVWSATQFATTPPAVRLTLSLTPNSPSWQVSSLGQGGIAVLPAAPVATPAQPVVTAGTTGG
ncbi:hypothetical protein C7271_23615, partial [filamentous cyanobacterium CCP5]